jgi:hypothetical protein
MKWYVSKPKGEHRCFIMEGGNRIATVAFHRNAKATRGRAALFAAAPELLELVAEHLPDHPEARELIAKLAPDRARPPEVLRCYQCLEQTTYLFPDARCGKCTRITPEELRGDK